VSTLLAETEAKRLELLHELRPHATTTAVLVNPGAIPRAEFQLNDIQAAARSAGQDIHILNASTIRDIDAAFAKLVQMRADALLEREQEPKSPFVFTSERGPPFATAGFARMIERAGVEAKLGFKVHPHMLRHACGYALANRGHDTRALQAYLGHKNIQHTVRYTELSPARFKNFWRE